MAPEILPVGYISLASWMHSHLFQYGLILIIDLLKVATMYRRHLMFFIDIPHPKPIRSTHFVWTQHQLTEQFFTQVQTRDKKVLHRQKEEAKKRSMNQKGRKWNSLYKCQGNFNVRWGTVELCSIFVGCGVKRAAAAAGHIYSDMFLHILRSPSKVYLF